MLQSGPHFSLADLNTSLGTLRASATNYVVALSATGVTAMALVQTMKDQTPLRSRFQRKRVCKWITKSLAEFEAGQQTLPEEIRISQQGIDSKIAEKDLVRLATDGDAKAFYGLEIEKLCGQLNAAAQAIIQFPAAHLSALAVLASQANPDDLATFKSGIVGPLLATPTPEQAAYIAARTQITQQVQRSIDALQIGISADWQTRLQQAALLLSVVIFELVLLFFSPQLGKFGPVTFIYGIFFGILSGFLAPVSRNIVAAIENLAS